ncbi:MAG TPA: Crp/Fnr family transcriptional regulator [Holophagaceae bacterium]|nr:Crp/Fnr family transcriptional regulator [Holophagaceae bacterium]
MNPTSQLPPPPPYHPDLEFFKLLPASLLARLEGLKEERNFQDGEFIYRQGDDVRGVYQLVEGRWKTLRTDPRGQYQLLQFLGPGSAMGVIPVFARVPAIYGLQSKGRTRCRLIPAQAFREVVMTDPEGVGAVLNHFSHRVRQLVDMVEGLSLHSVPERVAALLVARNRMRPDSHLVEFQEDQDELGHHLGCTRSAFNRALRLLSDMGLIKTTFPVVRIIDLPALERFAGEGLSLKWGIRV